MDDKNKSIRFKGLPLFHDKGQAGETPHFAEFFLLPVSDWGNMSYAHFYTIEVIGKVQR